jgi:hypothetical protein
MEADQKSYI